MTIIASGVVAYEKKKKQKKTKKKHYFITSKENIIKYKLIRVCSLKRNTNRMLLQENENP